MHTNLATSPWNDCMAAYMYACMAYYMIWTSMDVEASSAGIGPDCKLIVVLHGHASQCLFLICKSYPKIYGQLNLHCSYIYGSYLWLKNFLLFCRKAVAAWEEKGKALGCRDLLRRYCRAWFIIYNAYAVNINSCKKYRQVTLAIFNLGNLQRHS